MFNQEDDPSFRQNQKVSSGLSVSQSARAQKWLDQLVQVESRMLSNWEEFSAHRSDVQHRLAELTEAVRRKQEPHLESELEKCQRRLQQLSQSNEETLCRVGDLKTAVENGQHSLEGLRGRMSTKLQELHSSSEEQKKDLLSRLSEELQAEASSSKRQNKAVAEELLRKMSELNQKLGENMSSVEEESISRFEGLRGEVQALSKRLDATRPEVELRKTEAYFESQLRALRSEMHSQLEELAASAGRSETARLKGLQENSQDLAQRLEKVASEAASGKHLAERAETQMQEQLERLRSEIAVKAGKEAQAQSEALAQLSRKLQSAEELLERCCETSSEVEVLKIADSERAMLLEQLSRSCNELAEGRQGFLSEVDSCRSANRQLEDSLRRMDSRVESLSSTASHCSEGMAELKAKCREVDEAAMQRASELQELLERRAYDSSAKMEALRLADAERQRQLEQLSLACENLAEMRQGIVAEVESCRSIDRQLEEALRRLDSRVERAAATSLQCSEGVADVKAFARELSEKALAQCRDLTEKRNAEMKELLEHQAAEQLSKLEALKASDHECHQQLDFLSRALADLSEARRGIFAEVESCQSSDRKLEEHLRRMENKLERLSSTTSQCSEGVAEAKAMAQQSAEKAQLHSTEQLELRTRELKDQLKHIRDELSSNFAKEAKGQSDALAQLARKQELNIESLQAGSSDVRRSVEAQYRRQEQLERQSAESAAALQAVQVLVVERGQQLERISKSCNELSEARKGMVTEVENCRSIQRQLEDALHRVDTRLESVSSVAAQCSGGVVDVKAFAQNAAEKATQQSRELVELKNGELKELMERKMGDMGTKFEALKVSSSEHQKQLEQLMEQRKGLQAEVEQCRTGHRQLEDQLRGHDLRLERQSTQVTQAVEGVVEAKAMSRDVAEKIGQRCRELIELRSIELKDQMDQRLADSSSKLEALRLSEGERFQQLQQLQKTCGELVESNRGSAAEIESCQSIDRKLEEALRRVASQCAEGSAEMKVFARDAAEKTVQQCKEMLENRCGELKESFSQLRLETNTVEKETRVQREELNELKKVKQSIESTQELLKRQALDSAAEVQALKASDLEKLAQLDRISRSLVEFSEMKKGVYADLEACRSCERTLEANLQSCNEKISTLESQCHEGFLEVKAFAQEALKGASAEQTQQLEEARRGLRAEVQACQAVERQLEARLERVFAMATQCSEGLGELKSFSREALDRASMQFREQLEQRHAEVKEQLECRADAAKFEALRVTSVEHGQQLELLTKSASVELPERINEARRGLVVELEKGQSLQRQLEDVQRRCETRLEKVSSLVAETSSGLQEAKVLAQKGLDQAQLSRELTEQRVSELKELIEHQTTETSPKLEALRQGSSELSKQLQQLGSDLTETRRGLTAEVEKCQSASRHLEEDLRHAVVKIEKVSTAANQTSEGVAEVKAFAREAAEKAQLQSRQLMESSILEVKEHFERRTSDAASKIEALKASEVDQQQQLERLCRSSVELTETKKGLVGDLEKCQAAERHFEEALRRVDGKVEKVAEMASQCSEGVTEVKTFARQAVENVVVQSRDLLEQRTAEMKARSEASNEELRALRLFVQEETQRQVQAGRAEATEREHRLGTRLLTQAQEAQELRSVLDEQLKRQENLSAELREAQEVFHSKVSKVSTEFAEQKDGLKKYMTDALRKNEQKLQALTAQPRVLALVMEELEGVVRGVTQRELQVFQREALDSMEWKLERCVQWLHGANVKLGLNPQGTLFSTDRFREMLFEEAEPTTPQGSLPPGARTARVRSASARGRS